MSKPTADHGIPRLNRLKRRRPGTAATFAISSLLLAWLLASVFVHPLPHSASDRDARLLPGADVPPSVVNIFAQACVNCHSDQTRWPWYSHVAPVSWLVEIDVKRAREHLNLSRWSSLDTVEKRSLLTAIATVVENRECRSTMTLCSTGRPSCRPRIPPRSSSGLAPSGAEYGHPTLV